MIKTQLTIFVFIVAMAVCYVLTSFINLDFDFSNWSLNARIIFVFVSIPASIIAAGILNDVYGD